MQVTVKLFAKASDLAGVSEFDMTLDQGATVAQFRTKLITLHSTLQPIAGNLFVALNAEYAADSQTIPNGAEIACFPPVSGG